MQFEINQEKKSVYHFWNEASCGENLYLQEENRDGYLSQAKKRYELEPIIGEFAQFDSYKNKNILEIGVGLGADHQQFAEAGAISHGIDLTEKSIRHVNKRFKLFKLSSNLEVGDAENLRYSDNSFDLVYSWGVLHHSPDTQKAIDEIFRVLKKEGETKIMIYHKYSFVGYMLWVRYALLKLKPFLSLEEIYAKFLESPGTKAYTINEAKQMFSQFKNVTIKTSLCHGDLLTSLAGQRHRGIALVLARLLWPRWIIKTFFKSHGLIMLITAKK